VSIETQETEIDVLYAIQSPSYPTISDIQTWAHAALQHEQKEGALTIKIIAEAEMQQLNYAYRDKNKPTNVLSFPCKLPDALRGNLLGDIAICAPIVEKEASSANKPFLAHWAHLVVHGVLHLLGYNHEQEDEAVVMEAIETRIIQDLGFEDPYSEDPHSIEQHDE
jgi:probable rRNA maturation factor